MVAWRQEVGAEEGHEGGISKGAWKLLGVMGMFTLTVVMVSQVHTCVKR